MLVYPAATFDWLTSGAAGMRVQSFSGSRIEPERMRIPPFVIVVLEKVK